MKRKNQVEKKSKPSNGRLAADLAAMTHLHGIARGFVREGDFPALLGQVLDAAISIARADMATIEIVDEASGDLKLSAHRGFAQPYLDHFASRPAAPQMSGTPLEHGERIVVEDIAVSPLFARSADLDVMLAADVRASQLTPLRNHSGQVLGILSTHHRTPQRPADRDLELLDMVALQCTEALERARWAAACIEQNARAQLAEKLHESETRFRNTVENMPLNLVLFNREYRVLYVNPALAAICVAACNVTAEALVGMRADVLWPEAIWTPLRAHTEQAIVTRERQTYELEIKVPGRPLVVRQWTVVPLIGPDGEVIEILAMSNDITAQRRLVDELREADRRKSEFIAVLSHELRNPLAAIKSSLFVLEHGAPGSEGPARARGIIDRQVGQLVRITDDLLEVTRITQNKIQLKRQRLDLNALVSQTIADNRSHLERSGVRLEVSLALAPVYVDADGPRIAQVVTNLLSNAAKFTPAGGVAVISVLTDEARGHAVIRVVDTGAGIESALLERLFQPFVQADRTRDLSRGGLGLGLALVKGLVELHGGEVTAHSEGRGRGTAMTVRLPLATVTPTESAPASEKVTPRASCRVLIIEDDPDVGESLRQVLIIDRHQVEIARNGPDGLAKANKFKPDVLLCDIGLPGMDGYEVAAQFRSNDALRSTLLVALSGYAQAEDIAKAELTGFDEHVAKPPTIDRLRRILATVTSRKNG